MLDIKFVRENPEIVKQNIRNKFQDSKLELVDKVLELDKEKLYEDTIKHAEELGISVQISGNFPLYPSYRVLADNCLSILS